MRQKGLVFKTHSRSDDDNWGKAGSKITSEENLSKIKNVLGKVGNIVISHWFYRGASAPKPSAFDDYDDFVDYLENNAHAGDIIDVWSMSEILNDQNQLVSGKCPAEDGCIPAKGAY